MSADSANVLLRAQATESGAGLRVEASVLNTGTEPIALRFDCRSPARLSMTIPVPNGSSGRSWSGVAGHFKDAALKIGTGPGGVSATAPMVIDLNGRCADGPIDQVVAGGTNSVAAATWTGEIVDGVVASGGVATVEAAVGYDPVIQTAADGGARDPAAPQDGARVMYRELSATTTVAFAGGERPPLSIADAVDAVLAQPDFVAWIAAEPESSWTYINVFLPNGHGEGITPPGPAWR
jgi:hypothetical protein